MGRTGKPINGKQKGARFERSVCQRLSLWVSGMKREDVFWRSAMSGGRATIKSRGSGKLKFDSQSGDISAIHEMGLPLLRVFVLECKFINTLNMDALIYGSGGNLRAFWKELKSQCKAAGGKQPLLIAKENRREVVAFTTRKGLERLDPAKNRITLLATIPDLGIRMFYFQELVKMDYILHVKPHMPDIRRDEE